MIVSLFPGSRISQLTGLEEIVASHTHTNTHTVLLQVLCSCSPGSCQGGACPYRPSCWLLYNEEECLSRSSLHSAPFQSCRHIHQHTHTQTPPESLSTSHFSPSHSLLPFFTRSFCFSGLYLSYVALWFLPGWLFCWQTSVGCHCLDRGRSWVCRLAFRARLYRGNLHTTPTHLSRKNQKRIPD